MKNILVLSCIVATVLSKSSNWECNEDILQNKNLCIFNRKVSGIPYGPHNVDKTVGDDGFREVENIYGKTLSLSLKPFD